MEFQPDLWIFTKFMNVYQISADQWLFLHKFQNYLKSNSNPQCCLTRHFKNFKKEGSGEHFYYPEVGMLLRSKEKTTLFGPCYDVKCRSTSAAKKWKYAMANFTLTDQKSIINLTQFEAITWAKHNTQFTKWKIMTFVRRMQT